MKHKALITVSIIIVLSHILFVLVNHSRAVDAFEKEVRNWARTVQENFNVCFDSKATSMQQLATLIANDPDIQAAFRSGKQAVEIEGGGPGGTLAARHRQRLFDRIAPGWQQVTRHYDVRQLHFHLGPGATSFLRVHKPGQFGDTMDDLRHIIVRANKTGRPYKGFETGRHYTGIRGVVPVVTTDDAGRKIQIGALEAGTSYKKFFLSMKTKMTSDFCLLLTRAHVADTMTPRSIQSHFPPEHILPDFYIEETTNPQVVDLLESDRIYTAVLEKKSRVVHGDHVLAFTAFAVRDFNSSLDRSLPESGVVLVWKDATPDWERVMGNLYKNIIFAVISLLIIESILIFLWQFSRRRLTRMVQEQAEEIKENYERLNLFVKASPTGILILDNDTGKILDANPQVVKMIGLSRQKLISEYLADDILKKDPSDPQPSDALRLASPLGHSVPVLKIEVPLRLNQQEVTIVSLRDITREKEAEAVKMSNEKLQGVIEMAGAVSHELNQPMQVVGMAAELLSSDMKDRSQLEKLSQTLLAEIQKMKSITGKLMNITRYKTKPYLSGTIIDIDESVADADAPAVKPD